jgi:hypothetical protein
MKRLTSAGALALLVALAAPVVPARAATFYLEVLDDSLFGHLRQGLVPGCGAVACAPTAAANGLVWLQKRYPSVYDTKLVPDANLNGLVDEDEIKTAASALTTLMGCCDPKGTKPENVLPGKRAYIEDPARAPGKTRYQAVTNPNWPFLLQELNRGEAIELSFAFLDAGGTRLAAHAVTLTGLIWTDANGNGVVEARENGKLIIIDPADGTRRVIDMFQDFAGRPIGTSFFDGQLDGRVNQSIIELAVTESPIPGPGALGLLAAGLAGALCIGRRRAKTAG